MNMGRQKVITISVLIVVVLGVAFGYYYVKNKKSFVPDIQSAADAATQGVLPSIETNPLTDKPDINPTSKTNPFTSVKTNPFD